MLEVDLIEPGIQLQMEVNIQFRFPIHAGANADDVVPWSLETGYLTLGTLVPP
jgi:hypothetical protein